MTTDDPTTPTGPVISPQMIEAGIKALEDKFEWVPKQGAARFAAVAVLRAALAAIPAAEPTTTPEPDGLAERITAHVNHDMSEHAIINKRLAAHDAALAELREQFANWQAIVLQRDSPTLPAVPDAAGDDLEDQINAACREITRERTTKVPLTPAPPPLVVTKVLIDAVRHLSSAERVLEYAADYWNTHRVPAGDDQGDTPDVGGE